MYVLAAGYVSADCDIIIRHTIENQDLGNATSTIDDNDDELVNELDDYDSHQDLVAKVAKRRIVNTSVRNENYVHQILI